MTRKRIFCLFLLALSYAVAQEGENAKQEATRDLESERMAAMADLAGGQAPTEEEQKMFQDLLKQGAAAKQADEL